MSRGLFRDGAGRWRAGRRIALWIALLLVLQLLFSFLLERLGTAPRPVSPPRLAAGVVAVALASLLAWRLLDRTAPARTPIAPRGSALRAFGLGAALGLAAVALVVGALAALGAYRLAPRACEVVDQAAFSGRWLLILSMAAALEELLFRGYGLFALRDGLSRWPAIAITAVLFAGAHAGNPHFGWSAALGVVWIGVLLGWWVLASGTVWGAIGIHLGWNWALAAGAAIPVSGLSFRAPCYAGVVEGPAWLTGGGFGVEAGLLSVAVWTLAIGFVWKRMQPDGGDGPQP